MGALYASYTISFYISSYISSALDCELGHIKSSSHVAAAPSALGALLYQDRASLCTYYIYFILRSLRQIVLNGAFWHTLRPLVFSMRDSSVVQILASKHNLILWRCRKFIRLLLSLTYLLELGMKHELIRSI